MPGNDGRRAWKWLVLTAVVVLLAIAGVQIMNGSGQKMKCDSITVGSDGKEHRCG